VPRDAIRKPAAGIARSASGSFFRSLAVACLIATGCDRPAPYEMGQTIEMGPFAFSVTTAAQGRSWQSADGPFHEIEVFFRLDRDETAPFTTDFNSSFIDAMRIVDAAGNTIGCSPGAVNGAYKAGRFRSNQYRCLFRYSRSLDGVTDFSKIGTRPADFQLIISNPDPKGNQPRRVTVQLH
jgi:hypothetical protein